MEVSQNGRSAVTSPAAIRLPYSLTDSSMQKTLRLCCCAAALIAAVPAHATEDDSQIWLRASASGSISGPWQGSFETVLRFGNDADGLYEGEYGGSLGYQFREGVTLYGGYLRVPTYSRSGVTRTEDRFRQQLNLPLGKVAGGKLNGRFRIEERLVSTGDDMGVRLRPNLVWSRPFKEGRKTALVLSHESFINLNSTDWGQRDGYERMRNLVAVSTPLAKKVTAEIGYLNQYGFRPGRDSQDHVASLSVSYSF